jgi:hypothetical protein
LPSKVSWSGETLAIGVRSGGASLSVTLGVAPAVVGLGVPAVPAVPDACAEPDGLEDDEPQAAAIKIAARPSATRERGNRIGALPLATVRPRGRAEPATGAVDGSWPEA